MVTESVTIFPAPARKCNDIRNFQRHIQNTTLLEITQSGSLLFKASIGGVKQHFVHHVQKGNKKRGLRREQRNSKSHLGKEKHVIIPLQWTSHWCGNTSLSRQPLPDTVLRRGAPYFDGLQRALGRTGTPLWNGSAAPMRLCRADAETPRC